MNRFEAAGTLPSPATLTQSQLTTSDVSLSQSLTSFSAADRCPDFASGLLVGRHARQPLSTFAPVRYQAGYSYPLLVWLHGPGQSQQLLAEFMASYSTQNYVAVAPQSPISGAADPWPQTSLAMDAAEDAIFDAIEIAKQRFNVHGEKIFLAGIGTGGTAALRTAFAYPEQFAGVVSFDGGLPTGGSPLCRIDGIRELPVFLATGDQSDAYPVGRVTADLRVLHSVDAKLHLWHQPGDGDLTKPMLAEANRWMMDVACGSAVIA